MVEVSIRDDTKEITLIDRSCTRMTIEDKERMLVVKEGTTHIKCDIEGRESTIIVSEKGFKEI